MGKRQVDIESGTEMAPIEGIRRTKGYWVTDYGYKGEGCREGKGIKTEHKRIAYTEKDRRSNISQIIHPLSLSGVPERVHLG